jgi:hypothetical protein
MTVLEAPKQHEILGKSWYKQVNSRHDIVYRHPLYNIHVFEQCHMNPMETHFDVFSEDVDAYIVQNNFNRIIEFIRFNHPEWKPKCYVIHIYNSQAILNGNATEGKDGDYMLFDLANPKKGAVLLCKSTQLDVGDVVMGSRQNWRISSSEDSRLTSRQGQGYYSHIVIGGRKRDLFEQNPECVAEYKRGLRAWVWKGDKNL